MSKNSGMGRKRINDKVSKGLGKCLGNVGAEQCGNARRVSQGKFDWDEMKTHWEIMKTTSNPFEAHSESSLFSGSSKLPNSAEDIELLKKQAISLELELKKIKDEILKLNEE